MFIEIVLQWILRTADKLRKCRFENFTSVVFTVQHCVCVSVCLSVCLSVTCRYCVKMANLGSRK